MKTKNNRNLNELDFECQENAFALAVAVLRQRLSTLPQEDQNDFYVLLPALLGSDEEERLSAVRAVHEIFDQATGSIKAMALPASPTRAIKNWVQYVSARIREARESAGMTQDQLAQASGLEQSHISRLEKGEHSPTAKTLKKIADALKIDASVFDPSA